jgi:LysM repeat protein/ABC-type branched-subunit amino acid transport system substrate-binding protein
MKILFVVFSICFCLIGWSQPTVSGAFIEHTVEAGQTLYSISKKYNLSIDQIVSENPGADAGLRVGQKLRIPQESAVRTGKGFYVVKVGDTFYGISRSYGITVDELKALNNGMPAGLIPGDSIVVPGEKTTVAVTAVAPVSQTDGIYDIVVMLPFYTTTKDSLLSRDIRLREAAVHMYRGILAAADSLEVHGCRARIRVIDVLDNKSTIHSILKKKEMNGVDLVIGPLFKDVAPEVAAWCAANGAHMVVPVQQPNRLLLNAPAMSKAVAGSVTQWMSIARYAQKNFGKENVVLVDSKILDDRKLVESFKEEWVKLTRDSLRKVVVCDDLNNLKLAQMLPAGKCVVAVPSNDKKVIAAVFKALGTRTDVDVVGLESWDDMEAISSDTRNKFHVTFPKEKFADPNNDAVRRWQENYRKKFKSEPIDFSYTGYDVALYFGSALMQYGPAFPEHWKEVRANTIAGSYDFFRTATGSGFENASVNIIRTDNYQLTRVN